jgi:hypothetical protein
MFGRTRDLRDKPADQVAADATRGHLTREARLSARANPESGWPPQSSSAIRNPDGVQPDITRTHRSREDEVIGGPAIGVEVPVETIRRLPNPL